MYRKFYETLLNWEKKKTGYPLLVIGARQVGKTYLIREFCEKNYEKYLYLNFDSQPELLTIFEENLEPESIIHQLEILLGIEIDPRSTALFMDEVQISERAINSLKYFCEADTNYRIICAGSLLGVKLNRFSSSFPVGKVRIENLYPMDFEEFLIACGEEKLVEEIKLSCRSFKPFSEAIHNKCIKKYHDYLFVGGMPSAVENYLNAGCDALRFDREIHNNLLLAYAADMTKYTTSAQEGVKIQEIYNSIPRQLSRENPKFKYKEIRERANKRDFSAPLDWLVSSGLVYKAEKTEFPQSPLKAYVDEDSFKLYLSDTGLLCSLSGMKYRELLPDEHNLFKGAVTENYVIQTIRAMGIEAYYYKPEQNMEIDLLLDCDGEIVPVEVKSGRHKRSTSLKRYIERFSPGRAIRISELNFGATDNLYSLPLYAVFGLKKFIQPSVE